MNKLKRFFGLDENKLNWTGCLALVFVGVFLGILLHKVGFLFRDGCIRDEFTFINPDMVCRGEQVVRKSAYVQLKADLLEYIDINKKQGIVTDSSIYFRDLRYGPTLGINEHELFSPASLLKLPLLVTYINLKNNIDGLLDQKIEFDSTSIDLTQNIPPRDQIMTGKVYTIKELLDYMIKYSDNKAYYLLLDNLREISPGKDLLKETFVDLGILDPKSFLEDTISVKSYSSMLVQFFNSSFFSSKEDSEYILKSLAEVDWKYGLDAGVPLGTIVSHKFGERTGFKGGVKQLHDCGIVYFPKNPYVLCIMTRGYDLDKLANFIADISAMFYKEMESRRL